MRVGMRLTHSITALLLTETQGCSLHADSKTRVTFEYVQRASGSVEAKENSQCVQFSSSQHTEPLNAVQSTRLPGIQVPTRVSLIMGDLTKLIEQNVIKKTVEVHLKHNTLSG